jgi:hypothetical protein
MVKKKDDTMVKINLIKIDGTWLAKPVMVPTTVEEALVRKEKIESLMLLKISSR